MWEVRMGCECGGVSRLLGRPNNWTWVSGPGPKHGYPRRGWVHPIGWEGKARTGQGDNTSSSTPPPYLGDGDTGWEGTWWRARLVQKVKVLI